MTEIFVEMMQFELNSLRLYRTIASIIVVPFCHLIFSSLLLFADHLPSTKVNYIA